MIGKTIDLSIWGNTYTCKFPTTREYMTIQINRAKITSSYYESLKFLESDGIVASVIADMIAHFTVLLPTLLKDLNVENIIDLPMDKVIELCWIYTDTYRPFYDGIMETISLKKEVKKEEVSA
jgi:hypothetical protein